MAQPAFDFTSEIQDYAPTEDDALLDAMQYQWRADQAKVRQQGRIPDWIGEPHPLSKDKARLLEYLYDAGYVEWTGNPSQSNIDVARKIGLTSTINARVVIDQCHRAGLIVQSIYRERVVFQLTHEGEFALDEYQLDRELGIL